MKLVFKWVIIILAMGSFASASHAVTKDELANRVEKSMKAGLVFPPASDDVSTKESTQISYHRIEEMAAVVRGSSMKDIDEQLAKSIELEGSCLKIKWPSFGGNLWDVEALRYKELLNSLTTTKPTNYEPVSSYAYLIFTNNKEAWSLLNTTALSNVP